MQRSDLLKPSMYLTPPPPTLVRLPFQICSHCQARHTSQTGLTNLDPNLMCPRRPLKPRHCLKRMAPIEETHHRLVESSARVERQVDAPGPLNRAHPCPVWSIRPLKSCPRLRRMVPAVETHHRLVEGAEAGGCPRVEKARCARVYHLNLVVRLKARRLPEASQEARDASMSMQMERARLVINQQGIVRLEQLGRVYPLPYSLYTCRWSVPAWSSTSRESSGWSSLVGFRV